MTKTNTELTWDDWPSRVQEAYEVRKGRTIIIQNVSGAEEDEIDKIPVPQPPQEFKKDENGRPVFKNGEPEKYKVFEDPGYKKQMEDHLIARLVKYLEFGMVTPSGADIPGKTPLEKWNFVRQGVAGDPIKIVQRIRQISNLTQEDVDFLGLS